MKKRKLEDEDAPRAVVKRVVRAQRKFAQGVNVPTQSKEPPRIEQPEKEKNEIQDLPKIQISKYLNMMAFGNIIYKNPYTVIKYPAAALKPPEKNPVLEKASSPSKRLSLEDLPSTSSRTRIKLAERRQTENTKPNPTTNTLQPFVRVLRKNCDVPNSIKNRSTRQSPMKCVSIKPNKKVTQSEKLGITKNNQVVNITKPRVVLKARTVKDESPTVKKSIPVPVAKQIVSSPRPKLQPDFSSEDEIPLKRTRNATASGEKDNIRPTRKTKDTANVYIKSLRRKLQSVQIKEGTVNITEKKASKKNLRILASDVKTRSKSGLLPKKSFTDSDEEPLALKISDLGNNATKKRLTAKTKTNEKLLPKNSKVKLNARKIAKLPLKQSDATDNISQRSVILKSIAIGKSPLRRCQKPVRTKEPLPTIGSATVSDPKNKIGVVKTNGTHNITKVAERKMPATKDISSLEKHSGNTELNFDDNEHISQEKRLQVHENVEKWLEDQPMPLQEITEPRQCNSNDAIFKRPLVPPSNKTTTTNRRQNTPVAGPEKHNLPDGNNHTTGFSLKWSDIVCSTANSDIDVDELVDIDTISEYAANTMSRCNDCSMCKTYHRVMKRLDLLLSMKQRPVQMEYNVGESSANNRNAKNINQTVVIGDVHKEMNPPNLQNSLQASFQQTALGAELESLNENSTIASNNSQDTTGNQESEDHLFYLRFPTESFKSGVNLDDHLIQAVTVKLPHQKSIVRAKLVNKSDIDSINHPLHRKSLIPNIVPIDILPNKLKENEQDSLSRCPIITVNLNKSINGKPSENNRNQHNVVKSSENFSQIPSASISSIPDVNHSLRTNIVKQSLRDINPINKLIFPQKTGPAKTVEAPIFRPSEKEFQDPLEFIESITPIAAHYGICKIIPPKSFVPDCRLSDDMRFKVHNQYIHRMLHRWGPSSREMCAIKKYLATQGVCFANPPLVGGIELDLPKLYQTVQNLGGLNEVIEKKKWPKVVDEMKIPKSKTIFARLAEIYLKFLLPYDTLSQAERQNIFQEVEKEWIKKEDEMLTHSSNPLKHTYLNDDKAQGAGSEPATNRTEASTVDLANNREMEDCIIAGRVTTLGSFHKTAKNAMHMRFSKGNNVQSPQPTPAEVESVFWNHVTSRKEHVCVNAASIDSGTAGYGFPNTKTKHISKHPWNLKVLTNNCGSVLRSLGSLIGVTVPTIHVGMVFSTCCWYRDPHGLSWIEYLHKGAPKIWYSVPDGQSEKFRHAMETVVPSFCLSKKIWLPSDMTMVPPTLLIEQGVSLGQTVQQPGEFVVVFPRAYTSSISTGYLVSESVYFAPPRWLQTVDETFKDLRDSCEPTIFSLESLLISMANDSRCPDSVISEVYTRLKNIIEEEAKNRKVLLKMRIKVDDLSRTRQKKARNFENMGECDICRKMLCLSMVCNWFDNSDNLCLHHAIYLSNKKTASSPQTTVVYTWTIEELKEILAKIRRRLTQT